MITVKMTPEQRVEIEALVDKLMKPYEKYDGIMCFKPDFVSEVAQEQ